MRLALLGLALILLQQPADPAHPFPNHEQPPHGWFCSTARDEKETQTNAHACSCLGMVDDPMCGDTPLETAQKQESGRCKVWCHKDSCACAIACHAS